MQRCRVIGISKGRRGLCGYEASRPARRVPPAPHPAAGRPCAAGPLPPRASAAYDVTCASHKKMDVKNGWEKRANVWLVGGRHFRPTSGERLCRVP